jgi:hypothetical protein
MARVSVSWKTGSGTGFFRSTKVVDEQQMFEAGRWLAVKLIRRTQDGYDEQNRKFKPYSPGYAKWKNVPRSAVDLTLSGDMLNDFDVLWASRTRVRIGFSSARMSQRALENEQRGRFFLGIPDSWLREIKGRIAKGISFSRL